MQVYQQSVDHLEMCASNMIQKTIELKEINETVLSLKKTFSSSVSPLEGHF